MDFEWYFFIIYLLVEEWLLSWSVNYEDCLLICTPTWYVLFDSDVGRHWTRNVRDKLVLFYAWKFHASACNASCAWQIYSSTICRSKWSHLSNANLYERRIIRNARGSINVGLLQSKTNNPGNPNKLVIAHRPQWQSATAPSFNMNLLNYNLLYKSLLL